MTPKITMYASRTCRYCQAAERLLTSKGASAINKINIDLTPDSRDELEAKTGRRTVPQVFIGDIHVGGFDELSALDKSGTLDEMLANG